MTRKNIRNGLKSPPDQSVLFPQHLPELKNPDMGRLGRGTQGIWQFGRAKQKGLGSSIEYELIDTYSTTPNRSKR